MVLTILEGIKMANKDFDKIVKLPVDERCEGCDKVETTDACSFCKKYADPSFHWENDQVCSFASHVKREIKVNTKKLNPLKASKRAAGKKK